MFCSLTMFVTGVEFVMEGMTVANNLSNRGEVHTQGVALSITGDRAVLRYVRLRGARNTLFASSKSCKGVAETCKIARQYYDHCYLEEEVDFIFGNAKAVFHGCEIRSVAA